MKNWIFLFIIGLSLGVALAATPIFAPGPETRLANQCVRSCTPQPGPTYEPRHDIGGWCPVFECRYHNGEEHCMYYYYRCT